MALCETQVVLFWSILVYILLQLPWALSSQLWSMESESSTTDISVAGGRQHGLFLLSISLLIEAKKRLAGTVGESEEFLTIHFQPEQSRVQGWCRKLMSVTVATNKLLFIAELNSTCYREVQQGIYGLMDIKEFKACLILQLLSKYCHPFP